MIGVYEWYNGATYKSYVGSSIDVVGRKYSHLRALRNNTHPNRHLQAAFNKYGESSFEFRILQETAKDELLATEQFWIDFYDATNPNVGYNILPKAGRTSGVLRSAETKAKIGNHSKYRWTQDAYKRNQIQKRLHGTQSATTVQKKVDAISKTYKITKPDGSIEYIKNLKQYCILHGLDDSAMVKVSKGKYKHHRGYGCEKFQ